MDDDSNGSHLSVVLDLSPKYWELSARDPPENTYPLTLATFLSQLLAFLNAHIACRHENTLAVFGAFPGKSVMLYSSSDPLPDAQAASTNANSYPPFHAVDSAVVQRIMTELDLLEDQNLRAERAELDLLEKREDEAPSAIVGAIAKALCYVNRITLPPSSNSKAQANGFHPGVLPDPRILILSVSPDLSTSYIPIMNSIFSAQKLKATIDVCQIYGPNTVFLQQAAHLTGGSYIFLERRDALLQYLIARLLVVSAAMSFLPPPAIRKTLSVPTQEQVDFRAACFCHKRIIDIGFVCSVCLSSGSCLIVIIGGERAINKRRAVFCQPLPVCTTCRTKFPMKTLQRLNAARPLLATATGNSRSASVVRTAAAAVTNNGSGRASAQRDDWKREHVERGTIDKGRVVHICG
ncbi:transcription factor Tfb4 [Mycena metata]|uniref:General transcription and DNA repair factor IIH subunit TFB4 n=1 Tax=Mycena metata TaxID=1033252 RepID=A0AAD7N611_9AGAR|nr:transcription factor Tfb4 [Mycena metata]